MEIMLKGADSAEFRANWYLQIGSTIFAKIVLYMQKGSITFVKVVLFAVA